MDDAERPYLSYLLRLWRSDGERVAWRASLERPGTGERLGFAGTDELFDFLEGEMEAAASPREPTSPTVESASAANFRGQRRDLCRRWRAPDER